MHDAARTTGAPPGAPASGWASGPLGAVQAADREIARQTALRARAVAGLAAERPASADRQPGEPGAMRAERRALRPDVLADVSEWAAQELAVALSITSQLAEALLERSLTLVHRLPRTLEALESGALHVGHLWPMLGTVAPILDGRIRAGVEEELLGWAAGRVATPAQLGARARRVLLRRDVRDAAGRLERALRRRGVSVRPDTIDGMAVLSALLTVPEAQALLDALGCYADVVDVGPDDQRTRGQKMADCLLDLVLRPGEHGLPPVQAQLTVVAGVRTLLGGDEPGEVGGQPVPAEMVQALARALGLLPDAATGAGGLTAHPTPDEALADWWAATEARVLEEWGGEDDPPPDEMARYWGEAARREGLPPVVGSGEPIDPMPDLDPAPADPVPADPSPDDSTAVPGPAGGTWAAADRAVASAGGALLALQRAVGRAERAVTAAQRADADDEAAWRRSPGGRVSAAPDVLAALAVATAPQRAALAALLDASGGGGLVDRPRIAVVDALTGALLALTDSREVRRSAHCGATSCRRDPARCDHDLGDRPGLGPPPPSDGYRPPGALD